MDGDSTLDLSPALVRQAAILAQPATVERRMADAIRALAIDAVEQAGSGHPGMPMGMADVATALWSRTLRYDATDPRWPDRDRFVLSAGHGSMLLYALLHLTGHTGMDIESLQRFRRLDSAAAGTRPMASTRQSKRRLARLVRGSPRPSAWRWPSA